jgi:hypothetical protein
VAQSNFFDPVHFRRLVSRLTSPLTEKYIGLLAALPEDGHVVVALARDLIDWASRDVLPLIDMSETRKVFLTAEWLDLVMLNYEVDPGFLEKYVPTGTELDSFLGKTHVSLVGFRFCCTKLLGSLAVPLHFDFEEVNLRFYVRRKEGGENRRGVVFIAEIVPKQAVAATARLIYGENYICLPMKHAVSIDGPKRTVKYQWQVNNQWSQLTADAIGPPQLPRNGSLEQFITEHYWGYSRQRNGDTVEYQVAHVPWRVWVSSASGFEGGATDLYGGELGRIIQVQPSSAFIADGSPVTVFKGTRLS